MLYRDDPIGVLLIVFPHRQVFADDEPFILKPIAGFVLVLARNVVMERPRSVLLVDEVTDLIVLMRTKARDPARFPVGTPQRRVYSAVLVQGRDQFIAVAAAAGRMARFARKLKPNSTEFPWQRRGFSGWYAHVLLVG
jgi:hypothetical protein